MVFILSSWVAGEASSVKTLDRKREQRQVPLWSELTGRVDGWRGFASSKRFADKRLRDAVHIATAGGEIARQTIKS